MATCVPIKDLKNTAAFSKLVEESEGPVIVTKNGRDAFAVMTIQELDALRLDAARATLYEKIDEAEADFVEGRFVPARESQQKARARYGL